MSSRYETGEDGGPRKSGDAEFIDRVKKHIQQAWEHDRDNRRDAASDISFLAGDQWPESTRREREEAGRPMLTINRLPQFVRQVTNDIRQADLAIKVKPIGGEDDEQLTDVFNGILRQIHYRSSAHHVYSAAAEHQASCGIGWFRITADYADDTAFDQELRVEKIRNPQSVYVDPASVEATRKDAEWMAVTTMMPRISFQAKYPKKSVSEVEAPYDRPDSWLFWTTNDDIRIAEYWWKEEIDVELALMEDGSTLDLTEIDEFERQFMPIVQTRMAKSHKVQSAIISGHEILEGPFDWPGKHIPIIAVVGGEFPLESKTYRYGVVRFARDPQQLYNYARTAAAESIGLQPKAPIVATMKQIKKYLHIWNTAGRKNHPYLPYDADPDAPGPPQRVVPPQMSSGLQNEVQTASDDMQATTGIYDASLGARSNETSGKAILARDHQGDVANYHFIDNLKESMDHAGRILVNLIPKIYDNERVMRLMGDELSEEENVVTINQTLYTDDGEPVIINDLSRGRFDIRVHIGKSYSTKRLEQQDTMVELARAFPPLFEVAGDIFIKALDMPGGDEIAERIKRMIPPQILGEEAPQQQLPPPDPMEIAAQETQLAGDKAKVAEIHAKIEETEARTEKTIAETAKTYVDSEGTEVDKFLAIAAMIRDSQSGDQADGNRAAKDTPAK